MTFYITIHLQINCAKELDSIQAFKNANEMKRIAFSIETAVIREDLGGNICIVGFYL